MKYSNEKTIIIPYKGGVKSIPTNGIRKNDGTSFAKNLTLDAVLRLPASVYVITHDNKLLKSNEYNSIVCGYDSNELEGKSLLKLFPKKQISELLTNNNEVFSSQRRKIFEEEIENRDDTIFHSLSIKIPFYNMNNQNIGLLGISIVHELNSFASVLEELITLGFLNPYHYRQKHHVIDNIHLSARESSIIEYLVRGKTAREIAEKVHLSKRTIEHNIERLKYKLSVKTKSQLIDKLLDDDIL